MIDIDKLETLAVRANDVAHAGNGGEPFVHVPEGTKLASLEEFMIAPLRVKRKLQVRSLAAFKRYFNEFMEEECSRIYANESTVTITGILDDHHPGESGAQWCGHSVTYACPWSRQWEAWKANDRKKLGQVEFAEWLEDRVADVQEPMGGDLLDLCLQLRINRKSTYGSATTLASGETSFSYSTENEAGTVEIPAMITLGIPVFHAGTLYEVKARFRYRLHEGALALWYELVEPAKYVEDAFTEVLEIIEAGCNVEPLEAIPPK